MKTKLAILAIIIGIMVVAVEFLYEIHFILRVIGFLVGVTMIIEGALDVLKLRHGYIVRWKSFWMGMHYSDFNKRYCLNLLPGFTIWWMSEDEKASNKIL